MYSELYTKHSGKNVCSILYAKYFCFPKTNFGFWAMANHQVDGKHCFWLALQFSFLQLVVVTMQYRTYNVNFCACTILEFYSTHLSQCGLWNLLYFHIDIDECSAETDDCDQICTNTAGSYTCSCNSGYISGDGGRTCNGVLAWYVGELTLCIFWHFRYQWVCYWQWRMWSYLY